MTRPVRSPYCRSCGAPRTTKGTECWACEARARRNGRCPCGYPIDTRLGGCPECRREWSLTPRMARIAARKAEAVRLFLAGRSAGSLRRKFNNTDIYKWLLEAEVVAPRIGRYARWRPKREDAQ